MPSLSSSTKRTTRALLITGVMWLLSCWAWTIHHLIASTPPVTPLLTNSHNNLHSERTTFDLRQLDQVSSIGGSGSDLQDEHKHLRTAQMQAAPMQQSAIDDPPPKSSLIFPLHAKSGTHHAYLYVGSPPQRQTLIVDTGSRLTAFPCKPHCSDCGSHASPRFNMNKSTTLSIVPCDECMLSRKDFELEAYFKGDGIGGNSGDGDVNVNLIPNSLRGASATTKRRTSQESCKKKQCKINQRYTEGSSWNAFEVKDNVWLGFEDHAESNAQHATYSRPFIFGCQTSEQGLFKSQYADGILGMSMYTQTLIGSWYKQGSIQHDSFSLCFNSKGGHMSIGGVGSSHEQTQQSSKGARHLTPMQFIPLARYNSWYYTVHITSISVGEHVLPSDTLQFLNDHKGTIVDSGTTDTFLSHKVAKSFTAAWAKLTGRMYTNKGQQYTHDLFLKLPVITFEFDGGTKWEVRPEAYMESSDGKEVSIDTPWNGRRGFTSRVYVDEPHGAVLGANMMMDHEVYFDTANRRIGVARAECFF